MKIIIHSLSYIQCIGTVTINSDTHTYYGLCEGEFKSRYYNHTKSFRSRKYENETELSKFLWKLKDESKDYALSWDIAVRATPYKCGTRRCDLCLAEKVCIILISLHFCTVFCFSFYSFIVISHSFLDRTHLITEILLIIYYLIFDWQSCINFVYK